MVNMDMHTIFKSTEYQLQLTAIEFKWRQNRDLQHVNKEKTTNPIRDQMPFSARDRESIMFICLNALIV